MKYYKLTTFTLQSEKFQRFKGYNGRSDIEYKLNNGIVEIKDLIDHLYNSHDEVEVNFAITYIDQIVTYYLGLSIDNNALDEINIGRSKWTSIEFPRIAFNETKTLYGASLVSTSDDMGLNLVDEIVKSHSKCKFMLSYTLTLRKNDPNLNLLMSKLSSRIQALSVIKETTESESIIIINTSNQRKNIWAESFFNYLSELYYLYRTSSSYCINPTIRIHAESQAITESIASLIKKRSQHKNAFNHDYWFDDEAYGGLQSELKEKGFWKELFREDKADEYLIDKNFLISQLVPTSFVATVTAIPNTKIPGIKYLEDYEYGTLSDFGSVSIDALELGNLNHNFQTQLPIRLNPDDLIMHTLVTGVTGSGKTTTIKSMLCGMYENKIPFLILEPAKTEYKSLNIPGIKRYLLGIETMGCLKINPFEFPYKTNSVHGIHLQTHLDLLKSIFIAAFPMYGPMPYVLETAFYHIYQWYGWDFKSGHNIYWDSTEVKSDLFPSLDDLYNAIDHIVGIQGYSKDLQNDLTAALKVRIGSLKSGAKGSMLNTKRGTGISELLSCPTVVELERIGDAQEKVFIMGLLLVSIYEHYIALGQESGGKLKHLMVIEEAHRLLENVQQNNNNEIADMKGKALETFNNILSEIRAYGQGIVVADQIPTKISPDVIKNTNLKIVHRLFSLDDRNAVGDAIGLDHKQKKGLIHLKTGEAIVFHSGLQDAVKIMANSKGLEKGGVPDIIEWVNLNTLDILINTTRIYAELKKMFQTAIVLDWPYQKLSKQATVFLDKYGFEVDEHLIEDLISNLVHWFSVKLRNNMSISYNFLKELDVRKAAENPLTAIEEIRSYIKKHSHIIQYPESLESIYVDALDYFIYCFTEDRKDLSLRIAAVQAAHPESFRFHNNEVQNIMLSESVMDRYFYMNSLKEDEKMVICQSLVYYCSYPHTDFQDYFESPNAPVSDLAYLAYLKQSENQPVRTAQDQPQTNSIDVKPILMSIVENLQLIGRKQGFDPSCIRPLLRLPIAILLVNSLMIVLAVLVIILK